MRTLIPILTCKVWIKGSQQLPAPSRTMALFFQGMIASCCSSSPRRLISKFCAQDCILFFCWMFWTQIRTPDHNTVANTLQQKYSVLFLIAWLYVCMQELQISIMVAATRWRGQLNRWTTSKSDRECFCFKFWIFSADPVKGQCTTQQNTANACYIHGISCHTANWWIWNTI